MVDGRRPEVMELEILTEIQHSARFLLRGHVVGGCLGGAQARSMFY